MPKQANRKPGIHLHKTENLGLNVYQYFWILIAKNGKTIARSSETYKRKRDAVHSIEIAAFIMAGRIPLGYYDHTKREVEQVVY